MRRVEISLESDPLKHVLKMMDVEFFQCLMDLENSRDELLFELHKLPHQNPNDTRVLKESFADVQKLSDDLGVFFPELGLIFI